MKPPKFWNEHPDTAAARLLAPLAVLYQGGEALRRWWVRPQSPSKPIICVGNFTAGGAGKTPTTRWLAEWLKQDYNPAILSRGYKADIERRMFVKNRNSYITANFNDEALLLSESAPTFVGSDRHILMRFAIEQGHDCAIKDDGFQNPHLRHCFNLLVVDSMIGIGNGRLLPAGALRQPLRVGLHNADALLVIKSDGEHASLAPLLKQATAAGLPIFDGEYIPHEPENEHKPKKVFAFAGIAYPQKFYHSLEKAGYEIAGRQDFGDHHLFSESDAAAILAAAKTANATPITTEKDFMRLKDSKADTARAQLESDTDIFKIKLKVENETDLQKLIIDSFAAFHRAEPYQPF